MTNMAANPPVLFPEALTLTVTRKRNLQSCSSGDGQSKKKCITGGLWDLNFPSDLLREILSRLGLKANILASVVCKAWYEAAVSVRKLQPRPWLLYPLDPKRSSHIDSLFREITDPCSTSGSYLLKDPLGRQTYKQDFSELGRHEFSCCRDGWLLVLTEEPNWELFFLNPFTRERIYLPRAAHYCLAFSSAPTSTSCLVISFNFPHPSCSQVVIKTWRPGETVWTTHCFQNQLPNLKWHKCVFSNGMFYCLSTCGLLGVFDPSRETWTILPLEPCPAFSPADLVVNRKIRTVITNEGLLFSSGQRVLMMEHEGDVFVMSTRRNNQPLVFKLNLKRMVWEQKTKLGGLTVFASYPDSLTRACLPEQYQRNMIYPSYYARYGVHYYSLGDHLYGSRPPQINYLSDRIAWVDAPHNQVNLTPYSSF